MKTIPLDRDLLDDYIKIKYPNEIVAHVDVEHYDSHHEGKSEYWDWYTSNIESKSFMGFESFVIFDDEKEAIDWCTDFPDPSKLLGNHGLRGVVQLYVKGKFKISNEDYLE